jgi:hypothetical protein
MATGTDAEATASKKPNDSAFQQQRLAAWQPILSPPHVVGCLVLVAAFFLPIGAAIVVANNSVVDVEVRYDNQRKCTNNDNDGVFTYNNGSGSMGCYTVVNFTVPQEMKAPVYLYYKLTNFYQNHRRFAKSRSVSQMLGESVEHDAISDCAPFVYPGENDEKGGTALTVAGGATTYESLTYSPCGLVPWAMFNDSFALYKTNSAQTASSLVCNGSAFDKATATDLLGASQHQCHKKGIAWDTDYDKYKTPAFGNNVWSAKRTNYGRSDQPQTSDVFFENGWYAFEPGHDIPVTTDEDLMVWMRTASLPTFRKLYRVIDTDLPAGEYSMIVTEFFDVTSFSGTKSFALATVSWVGGENAFLGVAYLLVGALSLVIGVVFFIVYKVSGDRMQDAVASLTELQQ